MLASVNLEAQYSPNKGGHTMNVVSFNVSNTHINTELGHMRGRKLEGVECNENELKFCFADTIINDKKIVVKRYTKPQHTESDVNGEISNYYDDRLLNAIRIFERKTFWIVIFEEM